MIHEYLQVEVNTVPLDQRLFNISTEQFSQMREGSTFPIIFTYDSQPLENGYMCIKIGNQALPKSRIRINHNTHTVDEYPWIEEYLDETIIKYIEVLESLVKNDDKFNIKSGLELVFSVAQEYLFDRREFHSLSIEDQIISIIQAYNARDKTGPFPGIHNSLYPYIQDQLKRYSNTKISLSDQKSIADYLTTVESLPIDKFVAPSFQSYSPDHTHLGMDEIKDTIKGMIVINMSSTKGTKPILLLGEPGAGKTSLVKSIANQLAIPTVTISLGGVRDSATLLGFPSSYNKSRPGKIIQGLLTAKCMNPIFLLDEIDKAGPDIHDVLHHVLDGTPNSFIDSYLNFPIDLSSCIFISTANDLRKIPTSLISRTITLKVKPYSRTQKAEIIKLYLLPKIEKETNSKVRITSEAFNLLLLMKDLRVIEKTIYGIIATHIGKYNAVDVLIDTMHLVEFNTKTESAIGFGV